MTCHVFGHFASYHSRSISSMALMASAGCAGGEVRSIAKHLIRHRAVTAGDDAALAPQPPHATPRGQIPPERPDRTHFHHLTGRPPLAGQHFAAIGFFETRTLTDARLYSRDLNRSPVHRRPKAVNPCIANQPDATTNQDQQARCGNQPHYTSTPQDPVGDQHQPIRRAFTQRGFIGRVFDRFVFNALRPNPQLLRSSPTPGIRPTHMTLDLPGNQHSDWRALRIRSAAKP